MSVDIAVVTETWLKDGPDLEQDLRDLEDGAGLCAITLNRPPNHTGVSHGGVAVITRKNMGNFKKFAIRNPEGYEVLPVVGSVQGTTRKLAVVAAYIPPNYTTAKGKGCVDFVEDLILELKRKFRDPFIIMAGDFNQWEIGASVTEYPDIKEAAVGPTRRDRCLDRIFSNMSRGITEAGTVPPLQTVDQTESDHRIAYIRTTLPRIESFEWVSYSYRHYTEEAEQQFGQWIVTHDWVDVVLAEGSNAKAEVFQAQIDAAMDSFFPLRTTKKRSTDLPWINKAVLKKISLRNRIYAKKGMSDLWRKVKKDTSDLIRERKRNYMEHKKKLITADDANHSFFRLVKSFNTPEKPQTFDVRSLRPGNSDGQTAEELAAFFNRISSEFDPLTPDQIPITKDRELEVLRPCDVARRIKHFRKPKSMVKGDVFPALITKYSDFFAIPLSDIYNEVSRTFVWPGSWKAEYVTVIPKNSCPEGFEDLRNISCTMLCSKILESYVLEWAQEEVAVKLNQYGG